MGEPLGLWCKRRVAADGECPLSDRLELGPPEESRDIGIVALGRVGQRFAPRRAPFGGRCGQPPIEPAAADGELVGEEARRGARLHDRQQAAGSEAIGEPAGGFLAVREVVQDHRGPDDVRLADVAEVGREVGDVHHDALGYALALGALLRQREQPARAVNGDDLGFRERLRQ